MSPATCFRCDWTGETDRAVCPRCGVPLYRAERAPSRDAGERTTDSRPSDPHAPEAPPSPSGPRSGPGRVLLGLGTVALVALVAVSWLPGRDRPQPLPLQAGPKAGVAITPRGTLVYAAEGRGGRQELWRINLAFGEVISGPTVPALGRIVDASSVGAGWLGLTAARPDGTVAALVLVGTAPNDRARALGVGDLVAWGSHGESVAIAETGGGAEGACHPSSIDVHVLGTGATDRVLDEPGLCGELASIGRAGSATYYTRATPGGLDVEYVGVSAVPHRVLEGYAMVSVSPVADLLVTREPGPTGAGATVLFWRGHGGPVPLGTTEDALAVREVLAWSPDGSRAMVLGRLGSREGFFQILAGPGPEDVPREPVFVAPAGSGLGATYAEDGAAFLVSDGRLFSYEGSAPEEIDLPRWAPSPVGPIVWTP